MNKNNIYWTLTSTRASILSMINTIPLIYCDRSIHHWSQIDHRYDRVMSWLTGQKIL